MKFKINTYLYLILLFVGFLLLGNLISAFVAYITGVPLEKLMMSLENGLSDGTSSDHLPIVKLIVGINHFVGFTLASIFFILWKKKKAPIQYLSIDHPPQIGILMLSFMILMISYPVIIGATVSEQWFDLPDWARSMDESAMQKLKTILYMNGPLDLIINLIIIAILPGLGEEFLFRGILQKELSGSFKSSHVAIWLAAFIFSAFHLQIEGFMAKMILGLVFGYIYYYTKNLWYPILLHIANNGLQVISVYIAGDAFEQMDIEDKPDIPWYLPLMFLSLLIMIGYDQDRKKRKNIDDSIM